MLNHEPSCLWFTVIKRLLCASKNLYFSISKIKVTFCVTSKPFIIDSKIRHKSQKFRSQDLWLLRLPVELPPVCHFLYRSEIFRCDLSFHVTNTPAAKMVDGWIIIFSGEKWRLKSPLRKGEGVKAERNVKYRGGIIITRFGSLSFCFFAINPSWKTWEKSQFGC